MRTDLDYRIPANRWAGFDQYYKFTTATEDSAADLLTDKIVMQDIITPSQRIIAAFWFGAVGSPTSTILTYKFGDLTPANIPLVLKFFDDNKARLSFASDAKYRKIHFHQFLNSVKDAITPWGSLANYLNNELRNVTAAVTNYSNLQQRCIHDWQQWGRMGHWCMAEAVSWFTNIAIKAPQLEFGVTGKSHTRGWELARYQVDTVSIPDMERDAANYLAALAIFGNHNINRFTLETACCNYKRQHKGSRYAGCYIDELYDDLQKMKRDWPEYDWLYTTYMKARQELPRELLYEESNDFRPGQEAYQKSWHRAFMEYGRMPRVEAYFNHQPQRWCDIAELGYDSNLSALFG